MFEFDYAGEGETVAELPIPDLDWFDRRAVYAAAIVGVLVNLNALLIPIFKILTGGLVAGFVAGYAAGRPGRGIVQGTTAAAIVGLVAGVVMLLTATVLGMFLEPPAILLTMFGPVSPIFTSAGGYGVPLLYATVTAAIAFDGLLAGLIGGSLKALVHRTFESA